MSLLSQNKASHQNIPCEAFIDAQQNSYGYLLKLFIVTKLLFPQGKTRLTEDELIQIQYLMDAKSLRTIKAGLRNLQEKGWITTNLKTGYKILKSWDKIREENDWLKKRAMPVGWHNYKNIKALTGAVIYGYLFMDFWIKLRRLKSVCLKGRTYHFQSNKFDFSKTPAPVSNYAVEKIFGIPKSTASILKTEAQWAGYLKVTKDFSDPIQNRREILEYCKLNDLRSSIVFHNGNYHFQLIDLILPQFSFIKRKSIGP